MKLSVSHTLSEGAEMKDFTYTLEHNTSDPHSFPHTNEAGEPCGSFFGYCPKCTTKVVWMGVITVDNDAPVNQVLNHIYGLHNIDSRPDGQLHRSLSVGDLIHIEYIREGFGIVGELHAVTPFGFDRVPQEVR